MVEHVGFIGTRVGMTDQQRANFCMWFVDNLTSEDEIVFHHRSFVGAEEQAHRIARKLRYRVIVHPPLDHLYRANILSNQFVQVREPQEYIACSQGVVDESDVLLAAVSGNYSRRSNTWATIRYARAKKTPVIIFWPEKEPK